MSAGYRIIYESENYLDWITLLAYAAVRGGSEFNDKSVKYIEEAAEKLSAKETTEEALCEKYKHFSYYQEAYSAVLGGMLGSMRLRTTAAAIKKVRAQGVLANCRRICVSGL